jgi:O-antigen biosynthesis protein
VTAPRFSILILTYTKPDLLQARLAEIDRYIAGRDDPSFEVVVCDNGSPNREASLVAASFGLAARFTVRTLRLEPNRGFGQGFNHAMDEAEGDIWICLSDDVQIGADFLSALDEAFRASPRALICHQMVDWPAGWNVFGGVTFRYPMGYFLAAPGAVWDELQRFDPRFWPNDYEDVDLGMKAREANISIVPMPGLQLLHASAGTIGYTPERMEQTVRMRALFAQKWGLPNVPTRP